MPRRQRPGLRGVARGEYPGAFREPGAFAKSHHAVADADARSDRFAHFFALEGAYDAPVCSKWYANAGADDPKAKYMAYPLLPDARAELAAYAIADSARPHRETYRR